MCSTRMQGAGKNRSNKMSKSYAKIVEERLQEKRSVLQNKSVAKNKKASSSRRAPLQRVCSKRINGSSKGGRPHSTDKQGRRSLRRKEPTTTMRSLSPSKAKRRVEAIEDAAYSLSRYRRVLAAFKRLVAAGDRGARAFKRAAMNFNRVVMESAVYGTPSMESAPHV